MKNSFIIFITGLVMLIMTSCEKETFIETTQVEQFTDSRSSGASCVTCEAIDVTLTKLSTSGNCVTSLLTIELNDPDCNASTRHMVYMGEDVLTYFTARTLDVEIDYCETEQQVLKVIGYNPEEGKWNSVCFKTTMGEAVNVGMEKAMSYDDLREE